MAPKKMKVMKAIKAKFVLQNCFATIEGSLLTRYTGESGFSAYCRTQDHHKAVENKDKVNAFSKHLMIHHPDQVGNIWAFKFSLLEIHNGPSVPQFHIGMEWSDMYNMWLF